MKNHTVCPLFEHVRIDVLVPVCHLSAMILESRLQTNKGQREAQFSNERTAIYSKSRESRTQPKWIFQVTSLEECLTRPDFFVPFDGIFFHFLSPPLARSPLYHPCANKWLTPVGASQALTRISISTLASMSMDIPVIWRNLNRGGLEGGKFCEVNDPSVSASQVEEEKEKKWKEDTTSYLNVRYVAGRNGQGRLLLFVVQVFFFNFHGLSSSCLPLLRSLSRAKGPFQWLAYRFQRRPVETVI